MMTTKDALIKFYQFNRLNLLEDLKSHCVRVYIGCILAPVPNISARKRYLIFHDLHHIITGYTIDRIGESEVSAWELGTGTFRRPIVMVMNLFALSTGFILAPGRVFKAFWIGCRSRNLYDEASSTDPQRIIQTHILQELKSLYLNCRPMVNIGWKPFRFLEFCLYLSASMVIHLAMLVIGKLLLAAERAKLVMVKDLKYNNSNSITYQEK